MPYRIDLRNPPADAFDRLVALGALDVDEIGNGVAAILPDHVEAMRVAGALGVDRVTVSPAVGRDEQSVWIVNPRRLRIGRLEIVPSSMPAATDAVRLTDSDAFGSGLHPTTALCLEMLDETIASESPSRLLDVGAGSGVLALAALRLGVEQAAGVDVDPRAISVAVANGRLNGLSDRLHLAVGGPGSLHGSWKLVVANILAAPLIEMAPELVQRVAAKGLLVLSGIPTAVAPDVRRVYQRLGMVGVDERTRGVGPPLRSGQRGEPINPPVH